MTLASLQMSIWRTNLTREEKLAILKKSESIQSTISSRISLLKVGSPPTTDSLIAAYTVAIGHAITALLEVSPQVEWRSSKAVVVSLWQSYGIKVAWRAIKEPERLENLEVFPITSYELQAKEYFNRLYPD